jgi:uncharacterized protein with WD repeat
MGKKPFNQRLKRERCHMGKKEKQKKVNPKKERYAKFHKDKAASMDVTMPDLSPEQQKYKQEAEMVIGRFLRFNRNRPTPEIRDKKEKRK